MMVLSPSMIDGLHAHREKWRACEDCPLSKTRYKVVLFRGSVPADILLVGEGPGEAEDCLGLPFVGPAGRMLDQILIQSFVAVSRGRIQVSLKTCGASFTWKDTRERNWCKKERSHITWAITNIVACIPWDGTPGSRVRPPGKKEALACSPRLQEFVRLVEPRLLVTLGRVADSYVTQAFPVGSETPWVDRVSLLHPSAILRQGGKEQALSVKRAVLKLAARIERLRG